MACWNNSRFHHKTSLFIAVFIGINQKQTLYFFVFTRTNEGFQVSSLQILILVGFCWNELKMKPVIFCGPKILRGPEDLICRFHLTSNFQFIGAYSIGCFNILLCCFCWNVTKEKGPTFIMGQGFIQPLTDLHLLESKLNLKLRKSIL